MSCRKSLSSFLTGVLLPTGAVTSYTYNGYSETFDGDVDNLAQFVDTPASPPGEFPSIGATVSDFSFLSEGHTGGYYSWTFTVDAIGACAEQNVNFVVPIAPAFDSGESATRGFLVTNNTNLNLYDEWGVDAPVTAGTSGIGWNNRVVVEAYPGYSNGGTTTDITDDTFNPATAGIGIYQFVYAGYADNLSGFNQSCRECYKSAQLTIRVTANCTGDVLCFSGTIAEGNNINSIQLTDGTYLSNFYFPDEFNFPYDTDEEADALQLETDLQDWFTSNGGGTVDIEYTLGVGYTYTITNPCFGPSKFCLNELCSIYESPTVTTC